METALEIQQLLTAHSGEPVDYVAIVMLLNTVAGGHYEERHSEEQIRTALLGLLRSGEVVFTTATGESTPASAQAAASGQVRCTFRLSGVAA
ncbi:MAG: hypothetical protein ACRD0Y_00955 [Terriglobales bacterium]